MASEFQYAADPEGIWWTDFDEMVSVSDLAVGQAYYVRVVTYGKIQTLVLGSD